MDQGLVDLGTEGVVGDGQGGYRPETGKGKNELPMYATETVIDRLAIQVDSNRQ